MKRIFERKLVAAGGLVLVLVLLALIVWGRNGLLEYRRLKRQQHALQDRREAVEAENASLVRQIRRLQHDDKYIEHAARRELGVIAADEFVIKLNAPGQEEN